MMKIEKLVKGAFVLSTFICSMITVTYTYLYSIISIYIN